VSQSPSNYPVRSQGSGYPEQRSHSPARQENSTRRGIPGWFVAGLAVAAVGAIAWHAFGPDFRRYMKIRSM
jgi:hypothetical protein